MPLDLSSPLERNLTAGEYALGTLTAAERREVEAAAEQNTVLRLELSRWERQLAGLGLGLKPMAPRPIVWFELAQKVGVSGSVAASSGGKIWKIWSGLATAAALLLGVAVAWQSTRPPKQVKVTERVEIPVASPSLVAILTVPKSTMAWSVSLTPERKLLTVRAVGEAPAAAKDKDTELWWIGEDGQPVSLGVIPTTGEWTATLPPAKYVRGGTVAVSLEPPGGEPKHGPTGPVITSAQVLQAG